VASAREKELSLTEIAENAKNDFNVKDLEIFLKLIAVFLWGLCGLCEKKELSLTEITESAKKDYYVNDHGILSPLLSGIFLWGLCGLCERNKIGSHRDRREREEYPEL